MFRNYLNWMGYTSDKMWRHCTNFEIKKGCIFQDFFKNFDTEAPNMTVTEYINSYTSILVSSWYNSDSDSLFLLFLSSPRISFVDEHILLVRLILAHLSWNNHKWISEIKNRAPNALGDRRRLMNITRFDLNQFNEFQSYVI